MDETIGEKGGVNDRKRSFRISKKLKKKLQDEDEQRELAELEKIVKKQQRFTLIRTIPIVLLGGTIQTLYDISRGKSIDTKEEEKSKWRIKEYDADISSKTPLEEKLEEKKRYQPKQKLITVVLEDGKKVEVSVSDKIEQLEELEEKEKEELSESKDDSISEEEKEMDYSFDYGDTPDIDEEKLPEPIRIRFQKLKAHKIIETYEEELKDIRYEIRQLASDYQVLVEQEEDVVYSEEASAILDQLSIVIDRIEELKRRIQIEDISQYDDNYLYTLIEDYLLEFRNGNELSEIEDSPLYVLIAEKLNELDEEKDSFTERVQRKKKLLEKREERFEELRERFFSIERMNQELLDFQNEQDHLLREVQEKIENAVSVEEKVKVEVAAMNRQSRRLLRLLSFQMMFPGPRGVKRLASTTAAYLYFASQILHPQTTTRKYRVITVKDYSREIENSMQTLADASSLLYRTEDQVDKMIEEIQRDFQDYIGVVLECDQLLSSLNQVKSDLQEKEYELEKIKTEQVRLMEKNDVKVKKRGEYVV